MAAGGLRLVYQAGIEYIDFRVLPNGDAVAAFNAERGYQFYPLDGGEPRPIRGLEHNDRIVRWSEDGRSVFLYRNNELPARLYQFDPETGQRSRLRELTPPDPTGIYRIGRLCVSADASAYAYTYYMQLLDLHVIEGLR